MCRYVCELCGYEYSKETGDPACDIPPGVDFEDLPIDWVCPMCGASKEDFEALDTEEEEALY